MVLRIRTLRYDGILRLPVSLVCLYKKNELKPKKKTKLTNEVFSNIGKKVETRREFRKCVYVSEGIHCERCCTVVKVQRVEEEERVRV